MNVDDRVTYNTKPSVGGLGGKHGTIISVQNSGDCQVQWDDGKLGCTNITRLVLIPFIIDWSKI